ncbi:hypothetical protein ACFVVX_12015 [Kitasatospora sp. NPDC058170]|uniref:hypothetical protein n=1 Tax=Kitasatospora sp. NPDC058170 TaxID=3346364 RepID=UPI0036DAD5B3
MVSTWVSTAACWPGVGELVAHGGHVAGQVPEAGDALVDLVAGRGHGFLAGAVPGVLEDQDEVVHVPACLFLLQ